MVACRASALGAILTALSSCCKKFVKTRLDRGARWHLGSLAARSQITYAPQDARDERRPSERIPRKGERVERSHLGILKHGTVFYSDQLQILVKWDDGRSQSLRPGLDRFRVIASA